MPIKNQSDKIVDTLQNIGKKQYLPVSTRYKFVEKILNFFQHAAEAVDNKIFDDFFDFSSHWEQKKKTEIAKAIYQNENIYFIFFFIALIAKLAKIDGQVNEKEKETFLIEFAKLGFRIPDIKQFFQAAIDDQQDSEFYTQKIKLLYNSKKDFFETLITAMIKIAAADGPINNEEIFFLKKVSSELKINNINFNKIFKNALFFDKVTDPYSLLGVSKKVTKEELNVIYRNLAKKFHPDNYVKYDDIAEEYKFIMREKFEIYNKAYIKIKNKL